MTSIQSRILSPRLAELVASISSADASEANQTESFWKQIEQEGSPMIEPSDREGQSLVTWVVREGKQPIESVRLLEPFSWRSAEQCELRRLKGTDIWYLTWHVRDDLRGEYGFLTQFKNDSAAQRAADPLAREFEFGGWTDDEAKTSVLVMPNAAPLTWRHAEASVKRGEMQEHRFHSQILENERSIWVHTPAGYSSQQEPYPFVVIFDGDEPNHSAPEVIDNLIAAGKIPPIVAILVDQIGIRDQELPGNPDFSRAIATELVPWLRERYHFSHDPKDAVLNGGSYGGFCAGYTALHHSDVFGNAIMHSPSSWMHPNVFQQWKAEPESERADPVGQPADIPLLIQEFRNAELKPIRLWHEVGTVENGPPPARIWQTFGNRWLHDILVLKGYDTTYREYVGGHDHAWWRGTIAEGLIWVFDRPEE